MSDQSPDSTFIQRNNLYNEQEICQYSRLDITVIRQLSDAGLVTGIKVVEESRRYSEEDLRLLRRVRRMYEDLGVNIEGVEIILRLSARLEHLQKELERYRSLQLEQNEV
ncbi:chaperone modulator CbpM [Tengunoibacter tsumagoiensis]|uniref:HTH merR-type domain-containing protein n=1 Tax=Tengunoibacter tsumagoiensis TaxID=2014871 RepID=A0A402AA84_9CHLR|nr:chaperone modulator CbpM [Tengunoibacter tsumagoiensis]GCE16050.1 hypothetical protein KTT_59090 [Tengunoibacter tsumagoiensis]